LGFALLGKLAQLNSALYVTSVRQTEILRLWLLSDSSSQRTPLPFTNGSPLSGSVRDFHPQVVAPAGHT